MSPRPRQRPRPAAAAPAKQTQADLILGVDDASLLDIVDNVLARGVVLSGDVTIGLAQVDLIYLRLSVLLCAADRVLPGEDEEFMARHAARRAARRARGA
jgi:hypothetical protein